MIFRQEMLQIQALRWHIQQLLTNIMMLTAIIGPPLMTGIFGYYTHPETDYYYPGAPFILASFLAILSIVIASRTLQKLRLNK